MCMRQSENNLWELVLLPPYGSRGLYLGCQAWQLYTFTGKASLYSLKSILIFISSLFVLLVCMFVHHMCAVYA